jgi:hypothetical protein
MLLALLVGAGCREDVSLGSWQTVSLPLPTQTEAPIIPTATPPPPPPAMEAGAPDNPPPVAVDPMEAGVPAPTALTPDAALDGEAGAPPAVFPECNAVGEQGRFNLPGAGFASTEVATDWTWPDPIDSMQWDLMIERDVPVPGPELIDSGYYWQQHFNFVQGVAGRLGLQANGVYSSDSGIDRTKIAVFWISGPPLDAELGDIPFPDAVIGDSTATGVNWTTIHARFDWQPCRVYRLRFAPAGDEPDLEAIWYGAWITDLTTDEELLLGRMLLPGDVGLLAPFTISATAPFEFSPLSSCSEPFPVSAIWGPPTTDDGQVAELNTNRFVSPIQCGTSRITRFPGAVRHEAGVQP